MNDFLLVFVTLLLHFRHTIATPDVNSNSIIGIDFGTSFSAVSVRRAGRVHVVRDAHGHTLMPSVVAYDSDGRVLVGHEATDALEFGGVDPANAVRDVKQLLGRQFHDIYETVKSNVPFKLVENSADGTVLVELLLRGRRKRVSPTHVAAHIFKRLKESAETYIGNAVTHAVVAWPAAFLDAQQEAVKRALKLAGLTLHRAIDEPLAAIRAHGVVSGSNVLTLHVGGATFEAAVVRLRSNADDHEVVAFVGNTVACGNQFDTRLAAHIVSHAASRLLRECERAKRALTFQNETALSFGDSLLPLTRDTFNSLNADLFESIVAALPRLLDEARLQREQIDDIVLIGGSSRIVRLHQSIVEFFNGKRPKQLANADETVALGLLAESTDSVSLAFGIETADRMVLPVIGADSVFPASRSVSLQSSSTRVGLFRGNNAHADDTALIGTLELPMTHSGQLTVTFDVDARGELERVVAVDQVSGEITQLLFASQPQTEL